MAAQADPGTIFELNKAILRSQQRVLRLALACYLAGGLAVTAVAIWAAARPASVISIGLIAISAVQVDYYVVVVIVQLWLVGRDLRRADSPAGRLTLDRDGLDDGLRRVAWDQVSRVRVRRDRVATLRRPLSLNRDGLGRLELTAEHVTLAGTKLPIPWSHIQDATARGNGRSGLSGVIACPGPEPESSCRFGNRTIKFHIDETLYNTTTDDLVAAFARYTTVATGGA